MRTLPLLENRKSGGDKVKDFLGKGDYQPTGQGQEPLRTLGGIMALEGQTDLYDTPAQQFFSETYSEAFLQFHVNYYGLRKSSGSSSSKSSYWSGE